MLFKHKTLSAAFFLFCLSSSSLLFFRFERALLISRVERVKRALSLSVGTKHKKASQGRSSWLLTEKRAKQRNKQASKIGEKRA